MSQCLHHLDQAQLPDATIWTYDSVCPNSGNHQASVYAVTGGTYGWGISGNGTITAGAGTDSIAWTNGGVGSVTITVVVTASDSCSASGSKSVTIAPDTTARRATHGSRQYCGVAFGR